MPKSREQKRDVLAGLTDKIGRAKSVVFAKYGALKVKDAEKLRKDLKAEKSEIYVAKKTLFNIAFKNSGLENLNVRDFDGRVAAVFGYEDEVAPAKVIANFRKDKEKTDKIDFLGGILENKLITAAEVSALSILPSKQELYAKLVGSINAPVSGFVNVLAGNLRALANVLTAIKDKKQV
ncbi:MAG: 50S ribosomal protein L10 [Patescibacteria group bacterium]|nr:50S ribosomal protein L10 [Patescibacteria group bacterium]MDD4610968.1 50S ribosomal protein L10 [Patescibacteria group bacterium]